jgi:hypothetical protein
MQLLGWVHSLFASYVNVLVVSAVFAVVSDLDLAFHPRVEPDQLVESFLQRWMIYLDDRKEHCPKGHHGGRGGALSLLNCWPLPKVELRIQDP